uniref:Uncharacterized protein n=1 Tax=Neogobius melanostomus TaxID=47308 RepID=A0A8C6T036_9GOBI
MLFYILLTLLLPLTTSEVSTVQPSIDHKTTLQPNQKTPEATLDSPNQNYAVTIAPTTAKALAIVTPMGTTPQTSITQNQTIANLETTITYVTKDVQTSPSNEMSTSPVGGNDSLQSHDLGNTSKVVVPTERATTTRVVPTAKLSATTQIVPSVQSTMNLIKTTKLAKTINFIPKLGGFGDEINVQETTRKVAETTRKIPPPVVTKRHATSNKNQEEETGGEAEKRMQNGKIVAGLIGGALLAMIVGFLVILYKRQKLKQHQISTTEWAGPTPFLEPGGGDGDNGHVTLRSASRISLTSFLPQRLSKRLSLLAESAEEMQDMQEMTAGTTFVASGERIGTKSDQTIEKAVKDTNENDSEGSGKTEELVLVDEMKENEGETNNGKQNGQAIMKDGENGLSENAATQPASKEDLPMESNHEKEQIEKDCADKVIDRVSINSENIILIEPFSVANVNAGRM